MNEKLLQLLSIGVLCSQFLVIYHDHVYISIDNYFESSLNNDQDNEIKATKISQTERERIDGGERMRERGRWREIE